MIAKIRFTKMHGLGNDFVVLDSLSQNIKLDEKLVRAIADRHFGIGCDQVLLLEPPHQPDEDFFYRIFNADGTEISQCGNGARCIARYAFDQGLTTRRKITVGTQNGPLTLELEPNNQAKVSLGKPNLNAKTIPVTLKHSHKPHLYQLPIDGKEIEVSILSLGNPHCIINVPNINEVDLATLGLAVQSLDCFPEGVNVGVCQILARNHIKIRVFERGVGETLACGSGACAAVVAGILNNDLSTEVQVDLPGGSLMVSWASPDESVILSGPSKRVFEGYFVLKHQYLYSASPEKL